MFTFSSEVAMNGSPIVCDSSCMCDEILKSLARKPVTSKYSNTTAQQASCHQAIYISSNLNHLLNRSQMEEDVK